MITNDFLKSLCNDYCLDLIQDSTMFLQKLDTLEQSADIGFSHYLFNCDVEALYDSLKRETVILALRVAITKCRPDWSPVFIDWLIDSINLSLDSAIANFEGHWYCSNDGVATGGKLCVFVKKYHCILCIQ